MGKRIQRIKHTAEDRAQRLATGIHLPRAKAAAPQWKKMRSADSNAAVGYRSINGTSTYNIPICYIHAHMHVFIYYIAIERERSGSSIEEDAKRRL